MMNSFFFLFLSQWKTRYVEFKITAAGRLSFTVYREQPATPSNEVTQVSIEEYGGLDHTMKLDGEKHVFAIITTDVTECFAADSAATLEEWVDVIHEYLGKGTLKLLLFGLVCLLNET